MKTVWKYKLDTGTTQLSMPLTAEIVLVEMQEEILCLWALVDTLHVHVPRRFGIFGTGHPIPDLPDNRAWVHVGSFQQPPYVWHLFEDRTRE